MWDEHKRVQQLQLSKHQSEDCPETYDITLENMIYTI
jgi:hypothetical protein